MARKRTNGRFTKSTRRRKSKPKTNLTNLAVSALVANSVTNGIFNSNLADFVTGNRDGVYRAGSDGAMRLTLPELIGWKGRAFGGTYGSSGETFSTVVMKNFEDNWFNIAVGVIGIPIAASVIQKVIRKPIILPANRLLKNVGLEVKI